MKKILNPCAIDREQVFVKVEYTDGKLSLSGVVGPMSNGDCRGSAGQIVDAILAVADSDSLNPGWTPAMVKELCAIWDRWHLNDMRPGCEHQRDMDTTKKVTVQRWGWGTKYHDLRKKVQDSTNPEENAKSAAELARINIIFEKMDLHGYTTTGKHVWPEGAEQLLADGYIEADKTEEKSIGWVYPKEHPEGLLCKPCPTCGYKYGSEWKREEVPAEVIQKLSAFPDSTVEPAWV